jgi:hypothetical protein
LLRYRRPGHKYKKHRNGKGNHSHWSLLLSALFRRQKVTPCPLSIHYLSRGFRAAVKNRRLQIH